jgi:rRNA small subunit pseudouridine methyltransferase Nep1
MSESGDYDSSSVASSEEDTEHEEEKTKQKQKQQQKQQQNHNQPPAKRQKTAIAAASNVPLELAPAVQSTDQQRKASLKSKQKIIVLLDQARLETVKNKRGIFELLNCDDHRDLCKKKLKRDPKDFRPDIAHQELLALIDSPLNKAGCLQVYIRTINNVLIEVNPSIRIPRTYKRFSGLIVQLLHKMKIKAGTSSTTLMKVIKNPFSQHLPPGSRVYGMSCQGMLYSPNGLASALVPPDPMSDLPPVCFVIGAMATGHVSMEDHPYIEKMISVSEYPLSGAAAISRILSGIENHWGVV